MVYGVKNSAKQDTRGESSFQQNICRRSKFLLLQLKTKEAKKSYETILKEYIYKEKQMFIVSLKCIYRTANQCLSKNSSA